MAGSRPGVPCRPLGCLAGVLTATLAAGEAWGPARSQSAGAVEIEVESAHVSRGFQEFLVLDAHRFVLDDGGADAFRIRYRRRIASAQEPEVTLTSARLTPDRERELLGALARLAAGPIDPVEGPAAWVVIGDESWVSVRVVGPTTPDPHSGATPPEEEFPAGSGADLPRIAARIRSLDLRPCAPSPALRHWAGRLLSAGVDASPRILPRWLAGGFPGELDRRDEWIAAALGEESLWERFRPRLPVRVRVVDPQGSPIGDARVLFVRERRPFLLWSVLDVHETVARLHDPGVRIALLPPDRYRLRAGAPGFRPLEVPSVVEGSPPAEIVVLLEPADERAGR